MAGLGLLQLRGRWCGWRVAATWSGGGVKCRLLAVEPAGDAVRRGCGPLCRGSVSADTVDRVVGPRPLTPGLRQRTQLGRAAVTVTLPRTERGQGTGGW